MAYSTAWSDEELAILRAHYAEEGPQWVGWESLLPDRTDAAIMRKANAMGLRSGVPRSGRRGGSKKRPAAQQVDPIDRMVFVMLRRGMTPSQIDERMHWYRGTAIRVITGVWKGNK